MIYLLQIQQVLAHLYDDKLAVSQTKTEPINFWKGDSTVGTNILYLIGSLRACVNRFRYLGLFLPANGEDFTAWITETSVGCINRLISYSLYSLSVYSDSI